MRRAGESFAVARGKLLQGDRLCHCRPWLVSSRMGGVDAAQVALDLAGRVRGKGCPVIVDQTVCGGIGRILAVQGKGSGTVDKGSWSGNFGRAYFDAVKW